MRDLSVIPRKREETLPAAQKERLITSLEEAVTVSERGALERVGLRDELRKTEEKLKKAEGRNYNRC